MDGGVLPGEVVGIVGGHQGDARLLVQPDQPPVHLALDRDAVVLELQKKLSFPKISTYFSEALTASSYIPLVRQRCTSPARQALRAMTPS